MTNTCNNCGAWTANRQANPKSGQPRQGWCRRHAPEIVQIPVQTVAGMGISSQGHWPPTNDDAWCAEWMSMWLAPPVENTK